MATYDVSSSTEVFSATIASDTLVQLTIVIGDGVNDAAGTAGDWGATVTIADQVVNGGAIALGHPVGTTGSRLILTMLKHMKRHDLNKGLVSLCVGGGQGAAVLLQR